MEFIHESIWTWGFLGGKDLILISTSLMIIVLFNLLFVVSVNFGILDNFPKIYLFSFNLKKKLLGPGW